MSDSTDTHTPRHAIRVEEDLWAEFGRLVGARNRSQVIRDFIRWFVRERGATLPARPGDVAFERSDEGLQQRRILKDARNTLAHSPDPPVRTFDEAEGLTPTELQLLFLVAGDVPDEGLATFLQASLRTTRTQVRKLAEKVQAAGGVKLWVPKLPGEFAPPAR
ncbi:hypothetical protein [Streptosporangium sp. NPDC049078]|uniref:helix-turn-helix transcriptional regulator n=1 Tax=Streptosporangium sp. NPDC049078 TaxID=3155767 RepID=UPI003448DA01